MSCDLYIGHHLNTKHGFVSCSDYAQKIGANFFQIFLSSPKQYNGKRRSQEDLTELSKQLKLNNTKVVVHANYMLNFCNPEDSDIHKKGVKLLIQDLKESVILGAIGVVIHMGKQLDMSEEIALNNYVQGIKSVLKATPKKSTIIFETGAGQGTEICTSIFGLRKLYSCFNKNEKKRLKFCIDTCHIFSAGYDIGDTDYVDIFSDLIDILLKWENIACIHFNDSKCCVNSKKDRHADIGKGVIEIDGLKKFFRICCKQNVPIVMETPCENNFTRDKQIALVKTWV
jgi:deoxyribonuclease-4